MGATRPLAAGGALTGTVGYYPVGLKREEREAGTHKLEPYMSSRPIDYGLGWVKRTPDHDAIEREELASFLTSGEGAFDSSVVADLRKRPCLGGRSRQPPQVFVNFNSLSVQW